jgi:hypothetical protein
MSESMRPSILATSSEAKGARHVSEVILSVATQSCGLAEHPVSLLLTCLSEHDSFFEFHDDIFRKEAFVWK